MAESFFEHKDCPWYPCHQNIEEINCLFCYCPLYTLPDCSGNPEWKSMGENSDTRIKSCANCTFPHRRENYERLMDTIRERILRSRGG